MNPTPRTLLSASSTLRTTSTTALSRHLNSVGDADGRLKTTDFIRVTAAEKGYVQQGVWSLLGKPYSCMGKPEEVGISETCPNLLIPFHCIGLPEALGKRQALDSFPAPAKASGDTANAKVIKGCTANSDAEKVGT